MLKSLFLLAATGLASGVFVPSETRTCSTHAHCRAFGDTGATCETRVHPTGTCTCAANFAKISKTNVRGLDAGAQEINLCVATNEATSTTDGRTLPYVITITFTDALCQDIAAVEAPLQRIVDTMLGQLANSRLSLSCSVNDNQLLFGTEGGINLAILAELQISEIYSEKVIRFIENMQIQLNRFVVENDVNGIKLGRAMKNTNIFASAAANLLCPNSAGDGQVKAAAFVASMLTISTFDSSECKAIECEPQYNNINGVCTLPTPVPPTSDDELSGGQIAGVVIGCVCALVVIIAIIVWYCRSKKAAAEEVNTEAEVDKEAPKDVDTPDAPDA